METTFPCQIDVTFIKIAQIQFWGFGLFALGYASFQIDDHGPCTAMLRDSYYLVHSVSFSKFRYKAAKKIMKESARQKPEHEHLEKQKH